MNIDTDLDVNIQIDTDIDIDTKDEVTEAINIEELAIYSPFKLDIKKDSLIVYLVKKKLFLQQKVITIQ